ncbi:MAG: ribosomal L7Ae/L30e/S12e/Gadd45 family protein [Eubacterium sp.]|nr:ribosomal L7Ae/L30e/S12e/Gadd45 family protein [Eubacterium sp.]
MKPDKVLSMIGIAARAGSIASGEFSTEKAAKGGRAYLVILAKDASQNTKKHFSDMCAYREIPYFEYADKKQLGNCIGKEYRASLAVTDENLGGAIIKRLTETEQLNNGGNR